jgi:chorismate mutase
MSSLKLKLAPQPSPQKRPDDRLTVAAGPCSAESEEQVLQIAQALEKIPQVSVFRAGVWKPRTRPNQFEGVGVEGLRWLQNVKQSTRLATTVEVANAEHVNQALKFGVDILWVGARTTANPFSVQEIADALRGVDVPVWVKNPVNPDLQLWIGALERLNGAGVTRLAAIHRGFTAHARTPYRNAPRWLIPIELKRLIPELPILCDPSHIAGKPDYLLEVSQKALDLAMNGLMIETHIDPANALSDAAQQILPSELTKLLSKLQLRKLENGTPPDDELVRLRNESNAVDYELLEILARRVEVVRQIGQYKKQHDLAILQMQRWRQVIEDRLAKGREIGLEEAFVQDIYEILHSYAIKVQSEVMNDSVK